MNHSSTDSSKHVKINMWVWPLWPDVVCRNSEIPMSPHRFEVFRPIVRDGWYSNWSRQIKAARRMEWG